MIFFVPINSWRIWTG